MSRYFLLFFPVSFLKSYELKHGNEILSEGWKLTYITNMDDFQAIFCYLPLV